MAKLIRQEKNKGSFAKVTNNQVSYTKVPQSRKSSFLLPFLLFVIIFISDDTLSFGSNANKLFMYFKYAVYCLLILWLLIRFGIKKNVPQSTLYLLAIIIAIFSTALANFDFRGGYGYQIMVITLAFLIVNFFNFKQFLKIYSQYIFILSVISILVFIIANSFSWILGYFPVYENTGGVEFYNLFISGVFIGGGEIRNTAIFREPGVFMIYILFGIIIELFYCDKMNTKHVYANIIALFTTFSTAAFVILSVLCIGILLKKNSKALIKNKFLILAFIGICVGILMFYSDIYVKIFSKIEPDSVSYGSTIARLNSIVSNFNIFMANPFFGSGLSNYGDLFTAYSMQHFGVFLEAEGSSTNSFMAIFAKYGFLYGLILLFAFWRLAAHFTESIKIQSALFLSFILMFSNEQMSYSLLFNVFAFWGLKLKLKNTQHKPFITKLNQCLCYR